MNWPMFGYSVAFIVFSNILIDYILLVTKAKVTTTMRFAISMALGMLTAIWFPWLN